MVRVLSSKSLISSLWMVIRGSFSIFSVIVLLKFERSTANARPAGTRQESAPLRMSESSLRISSFSRPEAFSMEFERKEFEQTSSANPLV